MVGYETSLFNTTKKPKAQDAVNLKMQFGEDRQNTLQLNITMKHKKRCFKSNDESTITSPMSGDSEEKKNTFGQSKYKKPVLIKN